MATSALPFVLESWVWLQGSYWNIRTLIHEDHEVVNLYRHWRNGGLFTIFWPVYTSCQRAFKNRRPWQSRRRFTTSWASWIRAQEALGLETNAVPVGKDNDIHILSALQQGLIQLDAWIPVHCPLCWKLESYFQALTWTGDLSEFSLLHGLWVYQVHQLVSTHS